MMNVFHPHDDVVIAVDEVPYNKELTARERERSAVSSLLENLLGDVELDHDGVGKPLLKGYNISISHSLNRNSGYVVVMLSKNHEVGIDIEYRSNRIMKISDRFLREDEKPSSVEDNLIYWCAKEAVYKLFSSEDLTYQQMRVDESKAFVEDLKCNNKVEINVFATPEYILVWTIK